MHSASDLGDYVWTLRRYHSVHVVPRSDMQGYRIRIRWSNKLGLQLDNTVMSYTRAMSLAQQIQLRGRVDMRLWKKIFNPRWTPKCYTTSSKPSS